MVQFIFEGSRTNFSFWSTFAYFLVRTGVHLKLKLGQKKIKIKQKNSKFPTLSNFRVQLCLAKWS